MAKCYAVIDLNNQSGDIVPFVTADYNEIRDWAKEVGYKWNDDYEVEELPISKADIKTWAEQLKMKVLDNKD